MDARAVKNRSRHFCNLPQELVSSPFYRWRNWCIKRYLSSRRKYWHHKEKGYGSTDEGRDWCFYDRLEIFFGVGINQNWDTVAGAVDASPQFIPGPWAHSSCGGQPASFSPQGTLCFSAWGFFQGHQSLLCLLAGEPASVRVNAPRGNPQPARHRSWGIHTPASPSWVE